MMEKLKDKLKRLLEVIDPFLNYPIILLAGMHVNDPLVHILLWLITLEIVLSGEKNGSIVKGEG